MILSPTCPTILSATTFLVWAAAGKAATLPIHNAKRNTFFISFNVGQK
jgi:hypothetical protein